jgi:hypothetical protein
LEYNLTEKQKRAVTWMVEANRNGELDEEFSALWVSAPTPIIMGSDGSQPSGEIPAITHGVLDALASEGLITQDVKYEMKVKKSGTSQSEKSRRCTLTRRAFEAVDSGFVMPDPQPSSSITIHGDAPNSIIGSQSRAELTNNFDSGNVREQIERDGGEDREELRNALDRVERLLERGEYLDRGALSDFSEVMERHSWFTGSVMSALLGFATQISP